ncbi:MAG: hypothetical protein LBC73_09990 [Oscillospiraceae bacterium]|jgi:CBS domain containing-hemolysin-like protein|nr:hypothetical protein [Oscillospiraceae bacterium]
MNKKTIIWITKVTLISLVAAAVFTLASAEILGNTGFIISFTVLATFIIIGIIFDVIGIAVTAANEAPFNSMATRRQRGAVEALQLVKNGSRVTSYCNDVIGDVTGIISGTTAALIAARLMDGFSSETILFPVIISAVVTGVTVGGKAIGKVFAFSKSTEIVLAAGKFLNFLKIKPFSKKNQDKTK